MLTCWIWTAAMAAEPLLAFPGAEGFGAATSGGRGGQVLIVTTLAESGPGSLSEALATPGPRTIVFEVSGVIDLGEPNCDDIYDTSENSDVLLIPHSDVTIAGQTAPGAGITVVGRLYAAYDRSVGNVIVQHLRIRPSTWTCPTGGEQADALRFALNDGAMFDHLSVSWGVDENVDLFEATRVTLQDSIVAEGALTGHPEGEHNYGVLNNAGRVSVLRTLFAHNKNRNPALAVGPAESINNVAYNVRHAFVNHNTATGRHNLVGNWFKEGSDDTLFPYFFDGGSDATYHIADGWVDATDHQGGHDDPWSDPWFTAKALGTTVDVYQPTQHDFSGQAAWGAVTVLPVAAAYEHVLATSGAMPRDVVDARVVEETESRTGSWGATVPSDLLEGLQPAPPPLDADRDGMADVWEEAFGLDPTDGSDHVTAMPSGYTAIEAYIHGLTDPEPPIDPPVVTDDASECGCATGHAPTAVAVLGLLLLRRRYPY